MTTSFDWASWVLCHTRSKTVTETALLQKLWKGYGDLQRLSLSGGALPSAILKRVIPPSGAETVSDLRKRRSYAVEQAWYQTESRRCDDGCRVADCYAVASQAETLLLLLEDLNRVGFHPRRPPMALHIRGGLSWLAHFHSRFLGARPVGLWEQGGYWHLDTRREEWLGMPSGCLKEHAEALDQRLKGARYQTLIHGDSKPANFCWNARGEAAAVDFQYVGPGCGIRDVAYFLDCCLSASNSESQADDWLDYYFAVLRQAIHQDGHVLDMGDLEREWRTLFPVAWSDYCRFWQGWSGSSRLGPYSSHQLDLALAT